MRNCFIPFCDAYCRHWTKRMMFMPPKDDEMFLKWQNKLPKKRTFKKHDRVCERHFNKNDIITTWDHIINGELHKLERSKPKLKSTAIPELNLNTDFHDKTKRKRENNTNNGNTKKKVTENVKTNDSSKLIEPILMPEEIEEAKEESTKIVETKSMEIEEEPNEDIELGISPPSKTERTEPTKIERPETAKNEVETSQIISIKFDSLYDDIYEVTLPNTLWGLFRDPERKFIVFSLFDIKCMSAIKMYMISSNLTTKAFVRSRLLVEEVIDNVEAEYLTSILEEIDKLILCKNVYDDNNKKCEGVVISGEFCSNCEK